METLVWNRSRSAECFGCGCPIGRHGPFIRLYTGTGAPTEYVVHNFACRRLIEDNDGIDVAAREDYDHRAEIWRKFRSGFEERRKTGPTIIEFIASLRL